MGKWVWNGVNRVEWNLVPLKKNTPQLKVTRNITLLHYCIIARWLSCLFLLISLPLSAQQRMLPIGSDFKDAAFAPSRFQLKGPAVFPVSESDAGTYAFLKDSSKRYSSFGHFLYQRQLIEIKEENVQLWITPLVDFSYGAELQDSVRRRSQNTRGARMEGTLGKRIFFTTSFYENQAFLPSYLSAYAAQHGEQYAIDSNYVTVNAVIPGAARTKPFKTTGYDYAYATGMVSFFATPKLTMHLGNQPLFVGNGHRSLLWSDHSVGLINFRVRYALSPKWDFQVVRAKAFNLLRLPFSATGEASYETKGLSFATVYYQPTDWLSIGLFEGGTWFRGDSLARKSLSPLFYIPLPGAATIQESIDDKAFALLGLDFRLSLGRNRVNSDAVVSVVSSYKAHVYGQFALNPAKSNSLAYQLGARVFPFRNPLIHFQLEYNHADDGAYQSSNPRLNYSQYNLPIAHPMGAGFDEILLRFAWQKNYWFVNLQANYFLNQPVDPTVLMPLYRPETVMQTQQVIHQLIEAGYRFNRTYGLEVFAGFRYRHAIVSDLPDYERSWVFAGIRTQLTNHYSDF